MENSMFETLMNLPLFKGVSYNRLSEIVGTTRLAFLKYLPGETFIYPGDTCDSLKFLLSGAAAISISTHDERFMVTSTLKAPAVVMPEFLFGRSTVYPCKATAIDTLSILSVSKADFTRLLSTDSVFLFNYLNMISSTAQRGVEGVLSLSSGSLEERIAFWFLSLSQRDSENLVLSCRQRDLCGVFGVPRSSFIAALEEMKARGILEYDNVSIKVKSRDSLENLLVHGHS